MKERSEEIDAKQSLQMHADYFIITYYYMKAIILRTRWTCEREKRKKKEKKIVCIKMRRWNMYTLHTDALNRWADIALQTLIKYKNKKRFNLFWLRKIDKTVSKCRRAYHENEWRQLKQVAAYFLLLCLFVALSTRQIIYCS